MLPFGLRLWNVWSYLWLVELVTCYIYINYINSKIRSQL